MPTALPSMIAEMEIVTAPVVVPSPIATLGIDARKMSSPTGPTMANSPSSTVKPRTFRLFEGLVISPSLDTFNQVQASAH